VTASSVAEGAVNVKSFGVVNHIVVMRRFLQNAKESDEQCYNLKTAINHVKYADMTISHVVG